MSTAKSYAASVAIGEVVVGGAVGRVEASRIQGSPWAILCRQFLLAGIRPVTRRRSEQSRDRLGPSRRPGRAGDAGHDGIFRASRCRAAEAGGNRGRLRRLGRSGAVVGQIAKIAGCRVVGIVGSQDKAAYIRDELGFDAAVDYPRLPTWRPL